MGNRKTVLSVTVSLLGVAAVLGGTLGIAAAHHPASLSTGFNLVGGPFGADTPPDKFMECLPADSWSALYIWDAAAQKWSHFFNTAAPTSVPEYVNGASVGGITTVPRAAGAVLFMNNAVPAAQFPDSPGDPCP
jgi:hypothetical protein